MKVTLRQRKQTKKGKISLYLDIYKGTYKSSQGLTKNIREYEYLDLYLIDKAKNPIDKQYNKETLSLAESIRSKRELAIKAGQHGFKSGFKKNTNFIEYFESLTTKRNTSGGNFGNWDSTYKHLMKFAGKKVSFSQIDTSFCEQFKVYLINSAKTTSGKALSSSSVSAYYSKFRAALHQAVRDQIISHNPSIDVSTPRVIESERQYLTIEELKMLAKTDCRYEVLKRAFIFSCLTGLRWSDVNKLEWSEVRKESSGWRITFNQKKTKGLQYLDISEQAVKYLGNHGNSKERVFTGLKYSAYMNLELSKWILKAGITKDITFHCARHTFATMQLTLGTDIYTLSKLLGHSEIKTTQIYAKVIDEKRKEAINRIPDISF